MTPLIVRISQGGRCFVSPCLAIIEAGVQMSSPSAHVSLFIDFSNLI